MSFKEVRNVEECSPSSLESSSSYQNFHKKAWWDLCLNSTQFDPITCLMIHHIPSIETLDPKLQDVYKGMRPHGTPKYGLGYIKQCDQVIPNCRFNNPLPPSIQRLTITEMHKFHSIMMECPKAIIEEAWIKKMLNWDLFTHPESKEFNLSIPKEEKTRLSQEWQTFISEKNLWISFYVWRQKSQNPVVQMFEAGKESSP